jgi:hypothetical protein
VIEGINFLLEIATIVGLCMIAYWLGWFFLWLCGAVVRLFWRLTDYFDPEL